MRRTTSARTARTSASRTTFASESQKGPRFGGGPSSFRAQVASAPLSFTTPRAGIRSPVGRGLFFDVERPARSHGSRRRKDRGDARLRGMQAAQLSDEQVAAEHARPRRDAQVLPLVRAPHPAQGNSLAQVVGPATSHPNRRPQIAAVTASSVTDIAQLCRLPASSSAGACASSLRARGCAAHH